MATTVTTTHKRGLYEVKIVETSIRDTSEATVTGVPDSGVVIRQVSQLTAGTGSTVDPVLGTATNPAGSSPKTLIVSNDTAAASVDNIQDGGVPYQTVTANTLYHRSVPDNTATDHAVTSFYYIRAARP